MLSFLFPAPDAGGGGPLFSSCTRALLSLKGRTSQLPLFSWNPAVSRAAFLPFFFSLSNGGCETPPLKRTKGTFRGFSPPSLFFPQKHLKGSGHPSSSFFSFLAIQSKQFPPEPGSHGDPFFPSFFVDYLSFLLLSPPPHRAIEFTSIDLRSLFFSFSQGEFEKLCELAPPFPSPFRLLRSLAREPFPFLSPFFLSAPPCTAAIFSPSFLDGKTSLSRSPYPLAGAALERFFFSSPSQT